MYCTNCGNKLSEKEKYCTTCGHPVENKVSSSNQIKDNNLSLILGILSCILFAVPFISIPLAIASIIIGIQKKESKKTPVGIILGVISIFLTALSIILITSLLTFVRDNGRKIINDFEIDNIIEKYNDWEEPKEQISDIKGYSWLANDNSILYINNDNTYTWYSQDTNHEDNYHQGKIKIYTGQEALNIIENDLKKFIPTEEEYKNEIDSLFNFYLICLTIEKEKINEKEDNNPNKTVYYYGTYSTTTNKLNLTNIETNDKITLTLKEKLANIDV